MKILIIPDIHYIPEKDRDHKKLNFLLDIINSEKNVIFLGDFLHYKINALTPAYLNTFLYFFSHIKSNFIGIVGNHDITIGTGREQDLTHSWLYYTSRIINKKNIKIINKITTIDNMTFLPYVSNKLNLDKIITKLSKNDILFTHNSIEPFFTPLGIKGDGFDTKQTDKILRKYKIVISGHIHQKYQYKYWNYIGYVFPVNFTFNEQHNYIALLDSETLKLDYIDLHKYNDNIYPYYQTIPYETFIKNQDEITNDTKNYKRVYLPNTNLWHELQLDYPNRTDLQFKVKLTKSNNNNKSEKVEIKKQSYKNIQEKLSDLIEQYTEKKINSSLRNIKPQVIKYGKEILLAVSEQINEEENLG